jgi:hypothetical protein
MLIPEIHLIFQQIYQVIYPTFQTAWEIIKVWWWLPLPFIFFKIWKYHYLYLIQERWFNNKIKNILIEVKIPKEIAKPIKAMEQVFAGFHGVLHGSPNWRERWIDGEFQLSLTLEIVSIEGKIHFYIRLPEMHRQMIESNIYSQYPDAEISLVDDYTKHVSQDIPNKDWNIFGVDFVSTKNEIYPIKTYQEFEVEQEKDEEKKINPLSIFLEALSLLKEGEQMWLQIRIKPVLGIDNPWQEEGKKLVDKLARRPEKSKPKSIFREFWDAFENVIFAPLERKKVKEEESFPPEMKLTPGEKEVITAVEKKLSKFGFDCFIRFVYIAKKGVFFTPKIKAIFSFFKEISTENLGGLKPLIKTITKVKRVFFWFLDERRVFLRKRRIFRYYSKRLSPLYPKSGATFILNTEELATLFHFPSERTISTLAVSRVETKKREAPFNLPID